VQPSPLKPKSGVGEGVAVGVFVIGGVTVSVGVGVGVSVFTSAEPGGFGVLVIAHAGAASSITVAATHAPTPLLRTIRPGATLGRCRRSITAAPLGDDGVACVVVGREEAIA